LHSEEDIFLLETSFDEDTWHIRRSESHLLINYEHTRYFHIPVDTSRRKFLECTCQNIHIYLSNPHSICSGSVHGSLLPKSGPVLKKQPQWLAISW